MLSTRPKTDPGNPHSRRGFVSVGAWIVGLCNLSFVFLGLLSLFRFCLVPVFGVFWGFKRSSLGVFFFVGPHYSSTKKGMVLIRTCVCVLGTFVYACTCVRLCVRVCVGFQCRVLTQKFSLEGKCQFTPSSLELDENLLFTTGRVCQTVYLSSTCWL